MKNMLEKINLPVNVRKYLYGVAVALFALASIYGLVDPGKVASWLALISQIIGITAGVTAVAHMPEYTITEGEKPE